jgi:hypothetical protein
VSWFDRVVDAVQTAAVIGDRVERLSRSIADLAVEIRDLDRRVSRLEGALAAGVAMPSAPASLPPPPER